ncbi:MAG TPA: MEDS domain-containing protein [Terracidiphilus sp.]|nr:MEDS domain-containing protein [Terracidiphilus sp.]
MSSNAEFHSSTTPIFWGEIAPCEHIAQFYENDDVLLDTLFGFVAGGLTRGESTIVIATPEHLEALERRLAATNGELVAALMEDRYIALDASTALNSFMVDHWPDDQLFTNFVTGLLRRAQVNGSRVRAFGEMVALLWARGDTGATVRLEHLWQQFCLSQSFSLFCAYPKAGFTKAPTNSMAEICAAHSRLV